MEKEKTVLQKCVDIMNSPMGTVQQKMSFLQDKGVPMETILEALNIASGGAVIDSALGKK